MYVGHNHRKTNLTVSSGAIDCAELPRTEGSTAGVGTLGIWATSSCNLLVPPGPSCTQSHIDLFEYMITSCCIHPTKGLVTREHPVHDGQLRSHGTGWPRVSHSFSAKAHYKAKNYFSNDNSYLKRVRGLCSKTQRTVISLYWPPTKGSKPHPSLQ